MTKPPKRGVSCSANTLRLASVYITQATISSPYFPSPSTSTSSSYSFPLLRQWRNLVPPLISMRARRGTIQFSSTPASILISLCSSLMAIPSPISKVIMPLQRVLIFCIHHFLNPAILLFSRLLIMRLNSVLEAFCNSFPVSETIVFLFSFLVFWILSCNQAVPYS